MSNVQGQSSVSNVNLTDEDDIARLLIFFRIFLCFFLIFCNYSQMEFNFSFSKSNSLGRYVNVGGFFYSTIILFYGLFLGIISTPDAVLQAVIKRALIENGCPSNILNELMENAHERHWPSGLSTLETRQINRNHYISFVNKNLCDLIFYPRAWISIENFILSHFEISQ